MTWDSGQTYRIKSKGTDSFNNIETPAAGITWTFDNIAPSSQVVNPANNAKTGSLAEISGTSGDATTNVTVVQNMYKKYFN